MPIFGPVSLQRLELVEPTLADLMKQLAAQMSEPIGITQGLRVAAEQSALWAQGREILAVVNSLRKAVGWAPITGVENKKRTNAPPGYSWHEFGMAVDGVPFDAAMHADWDETHPVWQEMVEKGTALGLTSGISWDDKPHFQLTGRFPVTPTDEARDIMQVSGMQAVWAAAGIQTVRG